MSSKYLPVFMELQVRTTMPTFPVWVLSACMCVWPCGPAACGPGAGQKRVLDHPELPSQMFVSHHAGPLEESPVLLTSELSLQSHVHFLMWALGTKSGGLCYQDKILLTDPPSHTLLKYVKKRLFYFILFFFSARGLLEEVQGDSERAESALG